MSADVCLQVEGGGWGHRVESGDGVTVERTCVRWSAIRWRTQTHTYTHAIFIFLGIKRFCASKVLYKGYCKFIHHLENGKRCL